MFRVQNEGVRVFIQLYKEIPLALDLASEYAQQVLGHHNIVVSGNSSHRSVLAHRDSLTLYFVCNYSGTIVY